MKRKPLNQPANDNLKELLQQITIAESSNFGDSGLLYHLAREFDLIELLDQAAAKRNQGFRVGPLSVLMAIHRLVEPKSKLQVPEWYADTGLPTITGLKKDDLKYADLLHTLEYWDDAAIGRAEPALYQQLITR